MPNPADLFVSPDLSEDQARSYLEALGFRNPAAADDHLQKMADDLVVREALGRLAGDLIPSLLESPDPDAALAAMSHYVSVRTGRAMFLDYLREDPRALHVLTYVMGASPPLSEILIRTPEYFHWLVPQVERSAPDRRDHEEELTAAFAAVDDPAEALDILRRWKRREVLRIGTRELLRRETVQTVAMQLSDVAYVSIEFALAIVIRDLLRAEGRDHPPGSFAVIAAGQVGAQEVSYTSPLELHCVYDATDEDRAGAKAFFAAVAARLAETLREDTRDGRLYDLMLPAWPRIDGQMTARSLDEYIEHFKGSPHSREKAPLTRASVAAGDAALGSRFIQTISPMLYGAFDSLDALDARDPSLQDRPSVEIDRFTEVFQLRYGGAHPRLRDVGTLAALEGMCKAHLLDEAARRELDHAWVFLRSVEHRRDLGVPEDLQQQLSASRERVREICAIVLGR